MKGKQRVKKILTNYESYLSASGTKFVRSAIFLAETIIHKPLIMRKNTSQAVNVTTARRGANSTGGGDLDRSGRVRVGTTARLLIELSPSKVRISAIGPLAVGGLLALIGAYLIAKVVGVL